MLHCGAQVAVHYLVLAGQTEAAFQAARLHDAMPAFVNSLPAEGSRAAQKGYEMACRFYEDRALWEAAAELRERVGCHEAAVKLYLQVRKLPGMHP